MNEYIERERLLRRFNIDDMMNVNGTLISLEDARNTISNFPAADVAPVRHGRWGSNGIPDSVLSACSVCGFGCGAYSFQYCPNCGARMDALSNLAELEDAERSRRIESLLKKGVTGW